MLMLRPHLTHTMATMATMDWPMDMATAMDTLDMAILVIIMAREKLMLRPHLPHTTDTAISDMDTMAMDIMAMDTMATDTMVTTMAREKLRLLLMLTTAMDTHVVMAMDMVMVIMAMDMVMDITDTDTMDTSTDKS